MPEDNEQTRAAEQEYVRGGKGRRDEVGKSGIYPASAGNAPPDAEIRTEGELVGHSRPPENTTDEDDVIEDQKRTP